MKCILFMHILQMRKQPHSSEVNCTMCIGETISIIHFCFLQNFALPPQVVQISPISLHGSFCFSPGSQANSKFLVCKVEHIPIGYMALYRPQLIDEEHGHCTMLCPAIDSVVLQGGPSFCKNIQVIKHDSHYSATI